MKFRAFIAVGVMALPRVAIASEGPTVPVGVARVDITPAGPIRLNGYLARDGESKGIGQRIWAKALAIGSDEGGAAVLVAVDNLGVPDAITAEVAARLGRRAGLARERLTIGSSHTHTAPCLTGVAPNVFGRPIPAGQQARIDGYTRDLIDKLERVCLDALADRKPGRLSWTKGKVGFAANRRTKGGPVDHDLPVLKVTAPDGSPRAILLNYACHCTTINPGENTVSGDWAGFAQAEIEAEHPGCVALTLIGCGADANPAGRADPRAAAAHGRAIADEVKRLLPGPWIELSGPPTVAFERISLPFDTLPTRPELEARIKAGGPIGYNASTQLARLDRGESLPAALPYSTQAWKFGDQLLMIFLPGEVVVDYALRLKKEFDPGRLWVTAYANDVPCYIPSERILREGGYEGGGAMVYYGQPTRLRPGVEQIIVDSVRRIAGPGFDPKGPAAGSPPPLSPAESLGAFRVKAGLKVELVASEPLVESPVTVDFGADGRLWVCEMRDYPSGIDGRGQPGGAVKVLEDRDRDGRFETATTFLDGLPFPTGVMEWRKGVLICAAPEIIYAEDTDGDGKADVRRVLFRGFSTENFQARVNGLAYGLDNWVYGANGLIGGTIRGMAAGRSVDIGGRDFRMKPDTGEFEPASGLTQQGRVRDDWGNQFGGNNSVLIQHYPLPEQASRRNPRFAPPSPAVPLARDDDPSRLFPASRTLARYNNPESANHVTSACSPLIYRDSLLGPDYTGNAFACEPVHNLVRRLVLEPDGVTFAGHRAEDERTSEFLASVDPWCRPVQVRTGPDGALWVVDFYRFVIEHPRWISPGLLATLDVRAGADKGRIYRVVPDGTPIRPLASLAGLSTSDLAAALNSPNGTTRDLVHRLLVHRADRAASPILADLARTSPHPECRAQALGVLDGLSELGPSILIRALADPHPGVRREAVRLSGPWLGKDATLGRSILAMTDDPAITVRFQLAMTLGDWPDPEAGRALGRIAVRDQSDRWVLAAVMTSAVPHAGALLEQVIASAGPGGPSPKLIEPLIATVGGSSDRRSIARAMAAARGADGTRAEPWRLATMAGLLDASGAGDLAADPAILRAIASARSLVADSAARPVDRISALRLLGRDRDHLDADREAIATRLDPSEPTEVQLAAIRALSRLGDRRSAEAVLSRWAKLGPSARSAAIDALLAREGPTEALLGALEDGRVEPSQVDATRRARLLEGGPVVLRHRASIIFGTSASRPRQAVLDAYASARTIRGESERGKKVFERACAACHKIAGIGNEVGPDLAALTDRSPEALLIAILDPNREVDARYAGYSAALKDGRVLNGLIVAETASSIILKRQDGQAESILRADLEGLTTSGRSLMPEGLENDIKPTEMADLIAFLSPGTTRHKLIEGNQPREVGQRGDGTIVLQASSAEIYGPTLTFEAEFGNLGCWHSDLDHAAWDFHVDRPTKFTLSMEWACDDGSAGNAFEIRVDGRPIRGKVGGTGKWSNYRSLFLQEVTLSAGAHRLEMRPAGRIGNALADVRALLLAPRPEGRREEPPPTVSAEDLARRILEPSTPDPTREDIIRAHPEISDRLIAALTQGLGADRAEEYRRIPWIWRVAIAAGRRNDGPEIRRILAVSLPDADGALDHWRAVVLGGGLINGISQTGPWPSGRIEAILGDDAGLRSRWLRSLRLASELADTESVPVGTRYDALRMIGMEPWDRRGEQLVRYLAEGVDSELQQGAIGGLGDMQSPRVPEALMSGLGHYSRANRRLCIEALARDDARREALLDAVVAGRIAKADMGEEVRRILVDPLRNRSHERAREIFSR